jgi:LysM repeat protein
MKHYTKILLLVTLALLLPLTACTLSASKAPVATPTPTGEAPFPFTTPDAMGTIKTQTAVALTPVVVATNTPVVVVATVAPTKAPETVVNPDTTTTKQEQSGGGVSIPAIVRPTTYSLQKGEWPICIARRFNLDISTFFASNGLNMQSKPAVGKVLKIPASGTWSSNYGARALKTHPTTYTVVSGDTLYTIACRYGDVGPEQILAANSLSSAGDIKSGMKLNIP